MNNRTTEGGGIMKKAVFFISSALSIASAVLCLVFTYGGREVKVLCAAALCLSFAHLLTAIKDYKEQR